MFLGDHFVAPLHFGGSKVQRSKVKVNVNDARFFGAVARSPTVRLMYSDRYVVNAALLRSLFRLFVCLSVCLSVCLLVCRSVSPSVTCLSCAKTEDFCRICLHHLIGQGKIPNTFTTFSPGVVM